MPRRVNPFQRIGIEIHRPARDDIGRVAMHMLNLRIDPVQRVAKVFRYHVGDVFWHSLLFPFSGDDHIHPGPLLGFVELIKNICQCLHGKADGGYYPEPTQRSAVQTIHVVDE